MVIPLIALAVQSSFKIEQQAGDRWLVHGAQRLNLSHPEPLEIAIGNFMIRVESLDPTTAVITGAGQAKRITLKPIMEHWLENDDLWGGHKAANQLRYMHFQGGGLSPEISQVVPIANRRALAVIDLIANGPSARPVLAQAMVELDPSEGKVWWRRVLDLPKAVDSGYGLRPIRLFGAAGKNWFVSMNLIQACDTIGNASQPTLPIPEGSVVLAVAAQRFAIVKDVQRARYECADLKTMKVGPLANGSDLRSSSKNSDWVLFESRAGNVQAIHLPDRRMWRMDRHDYRVWQQYVIGIDRESSLLRVTSLQTGNVVARLQLPGDWATTPPQSGSSEESSTRAKLEIFDQSFAFAASKMTTPESSITKPL